MKTKQVKRIVLLLCTVLLVSLAGCAAREINYEELTTRACVSAQLTRHKNFSCIYCTGASRGTVYVDEDICIVDMSDSAMAYLPDGKGYLAQKTTEGEYLVLPLTNLLNPALADKTAYEMFAAVYPSEGEEIKTSSVENGKLTIEAYDSLGIAWSYELDAGTLDLIAMSGVRDGEEASQDWTEYAYDVEVPETKAKLLAAVDSWENLPTEESWVLTIVTVGEDGTQNSREIKLQKDAIAYVAFGQNCGYSGLYADAEGTTAIDIYSELDRQSDATVYAVYGK